MAVRPGHGIIGAVLLTLLQRLVGSKNEREVNRLRAVVARVVALEPEVTRLEEARLSAKTAEFKARLAAGAALDDLLPEAFAVAREAARRAIGLRPFDVQVMGGIVLHEGTIAEMKTGEGKTLVATLPLYLNALAGRGVHLVTVNDYLAKRDAQWMGPIYHTLGLSVGVIQHDAAFLYDPAYQAADKRLLHLRPVERLAAYAADITYGTNNEFGFDYLRDNMVLDESHRVQRDLHYAIVDEVDSILIDEARTPLIISGPAEESTDLYYRVDRVIPSLKATDDYTVEEKTKTVALTDAGNAKVERLLGVDNLYDLANMTIVHHVTQALKAHTLFKRDVDYVVKDGEVVIVDEFTGRLMPGRRWSDGLHQAVEAKEGVKIASENQTLATITFQNYFRMYKKLAGMTGTADTEAAEFHKIYTLDVIVIPTNRAMVRQDYADVVYRTEKEKFTAITEEVMDCHRRGQPVLVGTISIEKSERLSAMLKRHGTPHNVLNAKYHEQEAEIVAQAGRKGAVTIATNMAGRGVDILLGGNPQFLLKKALDRQPDLSPEAPGIARLADQITAQVEAEHAEVVALGGLHILGTERHESRRIDNQLRGRAGRQGDPGTSRFFLSLEDDLMRIFGAERVSNIMQRLGMEEGVPLEHRMVTRAIATAQKKVEAHNFEIRKQLLEFDDVMNKQREIVYAQRSQVLRGEGLREVIEGMIEDVAGAVVRTYANADLHIDEWDFTGLREVLTKRFGVVLPEGDLEPLGLDALEAKVIEALRAAYEAKARELGDDLIRHLERVVLLRVIDSHWKDHLLAMDYLKEGIGLRGYGQKDPLVEYKIEGFDMFSEMVERIKHDAVEHLFRLQVAKEPGGPAALTAPARPARPQHLVFHRGSSPAGDGGDGKPQPVHRAGPKVGRNDPCTCGSGKKYKKCHGR